MRASRFKKKGKAYSAGSRNFKSKEAYRKWLAYGHIHGDFKKKKGFQSVTIRGKPHKVEHGIERNATEFRIDDNTTIICWSADTRNGFKHVAELYKNGSMVESKSVSYLNRTWEKYEYETAISGLLDKARVSADEKKKIMSIIERKSLGNVYEQFKSVAMVAAVGDIFGKTLKEKNDWKTRMLKAGFGDKGLEMPEDWDTLSEVEKKKRLNKTIKFVNDTTTTKKKEIKVNDIPSFEFWVGMFRPRTKAWQRKHLSELKKGLRGFGESEADHQDKIKALEFLLN
jgi:hypothetical protein